MLSLEQFVEVMVAHGGHPYLVGGAVRDEIMHRESTDIDIEVFGIDVSFFMKIMEDIGAPLTGESFPVFRYQSSDGELEIALPRRERSTGNAYTEFEATVDPHMPVEEALSRRDFTMNAIAKSLITGEIIDPFFGKLDIQNRLLRPVASFHEDNSRVLRFMDASLRFDMSATDELFEVMEWMPKEPLQPDRIGQQLVKTFGRIESAERMYYVMSVLHQTGWLEVIFPWIDALYEKEAAWETYFDTWRHAQPSTYFATLMSPCAYPYEVMMKWGIKKYICKHATFLIDEANKLENPTAAYLFNTILAAQRLGIDMIEVLQFSYNQQSEKNSSNVADVVFAWERSEKISGKDLIAAGYEPGPKFGQLLSSRNYYRFLEVYNQYF